MTELEIKKRLEKRIIFGDNNSDPVTCFIYTVNLQRIMSVGKFMFLSSDYKKIGVINMDTFKEIKYWCLVDEAFNDYEDYVELPFSEKDRNYSVNFSNSKLIGIKSKPIDVLTVESSLKITTKISDYEIEEKMIYSKDNIKNIEDGTVKICILYVHSASIPIIKIKSLDQFEKDLESFEFGFDITNLNEENLIFNSHLSRVSIEEKKIRITKDIPMFNVDSMASNIKSYTRNEEIIKDENGNIVKYINHDTGINGIKKDDSWIVNFKDVTIFPSSCFGKSSKSTYDDNGATIIEKTEYDYGYTIINYFNNGISLTLYFFDGKLFLAVSYPFVEKTIYKIYDFIEVDQSNFEVLNNLDNYYNPVIITTVDSDDTTYSDIHFKLCSNDNFKNSANEFDCAIFGSKTYYQDNLSSFKITNEEGKELTSEFNSNLFEPEEVYMRDMFGIPGVSFKELVKNNGGTLNDKIN